MKKATFQMKSFIRRSYAPVALAALLVSVAPAAFAQPVLINSWENSLEGWSILETGTWTSLGFINTNGATQGSYSWKLASTGVDYGPTLQGPASTNLTLLMANADSVNMDIVVDPSAAPRFGFGLQIDLEVNQPGGAGTISVDGYNYPGGVFGGQLTDGSTNVLTWPVSQATRSALDAFPNLPTYLTISIGGGAGGAIYIDNLRATKIPQVQAPLSVRELWDGISGELIPANTVVTDNSSSLGFLNTAPWIVNPAETNNNKLMAFRPGFGNDPVVGTLSIGLPMTLDGSSGALLQENNGISFFPNANQGNFWTAGDFMTREFPSSSYINFQATGEYWFSMTIANQPWDGTSGSLDSQYVTFPSSGWGGIGFANGNTTNADFVAVGVTGLNVYFGPTNTSFPWGETNASKALYISQGTLGQPGNLNSTAYNPLLDSSANPPDNNQDYSQTNFTGGPYHINAFGNQTVGHVSGDNIVVLGHLKTFGNGTATLDAKYYGTGVGGNPWNTELDTNTAAITWDCSYSFNFNGTMTRMLLFQNGQFPFYIFGFRASTNFSDVVGLDPGRIAVAPQANTFEGYPINMTNLAVEANSFSFAAPPTGYGTLNYQWYQNGLIINGATAKNLNITSASTNDSSMPAGTDAGVYTCIATDPSGTWKPVTNSVTVTVTHLEPPTPSVQQLHDQQTILVTFNEPNLTGVADTNHYVFNNGVIVTNLTVISNPDTTQVQLSTTALPLGTKITLTVSGVTNVVGGTFGSTNLTFWTDLIQTNAANWDAWLSAQGDLPASYFGTFLPANPYPTVLQSMSLNNWDGPTTGITIRGLDGFVGDGFGSKLYGWFIPPVTTNYVFYISCDDGGRLSLSTNESPSNLCVIACESLWNGTGQWTNITDQFPGPGSPHRGDGTATGPGPTGYVWDNSISGQSPATASLQNRSDQFIVAYWDSSGITGAPGEPAGANDQANWATAPSHVADCIPAGMTNFWPNVDTNGQALIHLEAGHKYYMQLEGIQNGGGYDESVTYKIAGQSDPASPSASALTGAVIAGTVPFTPSLSIAAIGGATVINYNGVLWAGKDLSSITNMVAQSSASTAISLGGPSQYIAPASTNKTMFYRTSK
jgi:hypothetical protein